MTVVAAGKPPAGSARGGLRLLRLHLSSRRVPAALAAIAACAVVLRIALLWQWDAYGALQLPLILETGCAVAIAVTTASPFGEPERATGRWLPLLRLGTALTLTAAAVGALAVAGIGAHLAGGGLDVLRNLAGLTGIGLLCAAFLGGALAWAAPTAYLVIAIYALYTQWHGPALTTPWIWPARPPHDLGAAVCAGLVFITGLAAIALRGARDAANK
ncbi:hypothetical protein [Actinopolymorpha alba]|uniref:hypothetical protein n=1 Tax=Actinopolymorpha alba TaxID=533267 RepID=UPI000382E205|nr:hypothetical protein [Actinopolymorpha alba]